ncbi:cardiolipin synthase [Elizabethkingia anophelis]|nr:cardiolipin synthase [Elizabethkingia anophelis]MDV3684143.1 cardiolipin synthase [Elizabethkingia anophelis]MDV3700971.1 cardiolipin synthase [Elizabethkingia anophelis]MDV3763127.1 cardiolipin synthase [Elizabethkingia anophelis]MDV3801263.1 cardiolipin synthase [Elizabethkingia anophelis]
MDWEFITTQAWQFIKEWYWIPLTIFYTFIIVTILIENRNPPKTIAWILVIICRPIIGIIIYFFFGQEFKKEQYFKRIDQKQKEIIQNKWNQLDSFIEKDLLQIHERIGDLAQCYHYLNNTRVSPPSTNNKVTLLTNGNEKFPLFLEALREAKNHIHLEYYIFEEDKIGNEIINLLIEKAKNGVEVRVMVDDFGSPKINKHKKRFKGTKVQFQTFLPVRFSSLANSNYRNHRKILIVDGKKAFVGGINISDKYINTPKSKIYWRDTSIMIEGDSINTLQLYFFLDWMMTEGKQYELSNTQYFFPSSPIKDKTLTAVSFGLTSPGSPIHSAMEAMILGITSAKKKVQICTPYFIPSDEFKTALLIAASSGVEVEMIIPYKGDSTVVQQASLSFLKPLLQRGVKIYLYRKGFIHAKTITIDDKLAYIGTVNLDFRSFYINFEITSIIENNTLLNEMLIQFEKDRIDSELFSLKKWEQRPWYNRALASLCRLLAPIL